jgi:hypothetical protein
MDKMFQLVKLEYPIQKAIFIEKTDLMPENCPIRDGSQAGYPKKALVLWPVAAHQTPFRSFCGSLFVPFKRTRLDWSVPHRAMEIDQVLKGWRVVKK